MSFYAEQGPEIQILNGALSLLCGAGASEAERDRVQLVLLELAQDGLTTIEELVARATDLLEEDVEQSDA